MAYTHTCAACGTSNNLVGSLGGVLLCRDHFEDIRDEVERLRADGKMVNVAGIARRMFREQFGAETLAIRDVPTGLMEQAKLYAAMAKISVRELILEAISEYLANHKA